MIWPFKRKPRPVPCQQALAEAPPKVSPSSVVLRDATFVDHYLDLTGRDIERCRFDGCILLMRPGSRGRMWYCQIQDCILAGGGWPPEMLRALPEWPG